MIIKGNAYWAKVLGKPAKGYNEGEFEWSIDVTVNAETRKLLAEAGIADRIKNKNDARGDFIQFKRKSVKYDGTPAKPIRVVDAAGKPWDQDTLIGNGSVVNVQFLINEIPLAGGKRVIIKPSVVAIQVWELVPYEGGNREDFPTKSTDTESWEEVA